MIKDDSLTIEDAHVVFRNFSGEEKMYNRAGDRNFCVILPPDLAEVMQKDGWLIKTLKARGDAEPEFYLQVAVGFKFRAPRMVMITTKNRTVLDEETCDLLDTCEAMTWDLTIRPYRWEVNGKTGVKAYLRTVFAVLHEDYLELKYENYGQPQLESGSSDSDKVLDVEWYETQYELEG